MHRCRAGSYQSENGPYSCELDKLRKRAPAVQVQSTLVSVTTPMGEEYVPDMRPISRARSDDLNKPMLYRLQVRC